jgi:uncharacterized protein (TIGR02594 family)
LVNDKNIWIMNDLVQKYNWLLQEPGPASLKEALSHYGLLECIGKNSNPDIMKWAKEVGVSGWYPDDSVAWCGLFMGICQKRAGFPYNSQLLSALAWAKWGDHIDNDKAELGDTLIFIRSGGGHVAFYIGEGKDNFLVLGGNQGNAVGFEWVSKTRLFAVRRAHWKISQPANIRKILLSDSGAVLAHNEA